MSKNYKKICLALSLAGVLGAGAVTAQSGSKKVDITYRNIQVTHNGVTQSMSEEPFLLNGTTYVPLRAVGDIFGVDADWLYQSNTVALTGGSSASNSDEVTQLNYQLTALRQELSTANTELAQCKAELAQYKNQNTTTTTGTSTGTNITADQLKNTENYLNENLYDALGNNISLYYSLTTSGNQINVRISYDNRNENNTYNNLTQQKIEAFMKRVGDNIAASHNDITIEGTIEYTNESEEKGSFTRSKVGKYTFTHAFDEESLQEAIEDETDNYFNLDNVNTALYINNIDVTVRPNKSTVNVKLYVDPNTTFTDFWCSHKATDGTVTDPVSNTSSRKNAVERQLEDIQSLVLDLTGGYDVSIYVYYNNSVVIAEMDANGKVSTETFQVTQ